MWSTVTNGKLRSTLFVLLLFIILLLHQNVFAAATVTITPDTAIADKFIRHTVTGITTPLPQLPDVPGFLGSSFVSVGSLKKKEGGELSIVSSSGEGSDGNYMTLNGEIAVFTWNGRDLDSWKQGIINNTFSFPNVPVLTDMDGDGDLDILVGDNFVTGFVTKFHAGIYWLENKRGVLTKTENWVKHTIYEGGDNPTGISGLMRVAVLDVDGDGKQDIITSRLDLGTWQTYVPKYPPVDPPPYEPQFSFMEVFRQETPDYLQTDADGAVGKGGTCYGYSRHVIGDGAGFQFGLADFDEDGDLDIYAPQFLITYFGEYIVRPDIHGDSLIWFENPGASSAALEAWTRHTISNNTTSGNPIGRGYVVLNEDIDNDGKKELIFSSNNHQDYKNGHRLWPSGVFFLDIPEDPKVTANWSDPITIETGDPNLDPDNATAVANDLYACDRPGNPNSTGSPGDIRTGDINNDGYLDLVVPGDSKGAVYYYESSGSSPEALKFKRTTLYVDQGTITGGCAIVDIDGDGDLDIVQGMYDTSVLQPGDTDYVKLASSSIFIYENTTITKKCPLKRLLGEDNPTLANLRAFRDSSLVETALGRKAIQIYYNNSDTINTALTRSPALRAVTRSVLEVIAPMIGKN